MISWFAKNGVAANLLMVLMLVGGILVVPTIKVELFPEFESDRISVTVPFRGGNPGEVEEQIVKRIEEEIQDVEGIKELVSSASEGRGVVTAEVEKGYDPRELVEDIKSRVDAIDTFPDDAERPIVEERVIKSDVCSLTLHGQTDERTLKELAERIRDDVLALPGITQVEITGVREYQIAIEVSEEALRRYSLNFESVVQAVRRTSIDLPGGNLKTSGGEILLRTKGQAYTAVDFKSIPVVYNPDGTHVSLGEIATIVDGFEDETLVSRFNGQPAVQIIVYEVGKQNPLKMIEQLRKFVPELNQRLPEGLKLTLWRDTTFYLKGRLELLISDGISGLILVLITLSLFLKPSVAFWVMMDIPISVMATFLVMAWMGVSINLVSLFGFILVLGILVDDAIVIGESVFSEYEKRGPGVESAIRGTKLVSTPVTFSVMTTMVAFLPLLNLPGFTGKLFGDIPLIVIPCLLMSLIESKLVLPNHLAMEKRLSDQKIGKWNLLARVQGYVDSGLRWFIRFVYQPGLNTCVSNRYATLTFFVGVMFVLVAGIYSGWVKFTPFPPVPSDYIFVNLVYPEGTPTSETQKGLDRLLAGLDSVVKETLDDGRAHPLENVLDTLGITVRGGGPEGTRTSSVQSHLASIAVELRKSENRDPRDNAVDLSKRWRKAVGPLPGVSALTFTSQAGGGQGEPVDIQLSARNPSALRPAANEIKRVLESYAGIYDIRDNLNDAQKEIKLRIKPEAEVLGLTQADLGSQVRAAFFGVEAQRVQRGRDDIRVMVRYPDANRRSIADLENLRIRTPAGLEVPFSEVAEAEYGLGYSSIRRVDREQVVNIYADADKQGIDLQAVKEELMTRVLPELQQRFAQEGLKYLMKGESKELEDTNQSLGIGLAFSLLGIYALLAIPFKSYFQPFLIMNAIPYGAVGAIIGHVVMGRSVSLLSIFGIVAVAGVVVNDGIVLMDFINQRIAEGRGNRRKILLAAVLESGSARLRAIFMTSVTTVVGLIPILGEKSLQAQFLIPMAISLAFGVAFATVVTLVLLPCTYVILDDVNRGFSAFYRWYFNKPQTKPETEDFYFVQDPDIHVPDKDYADGESGNDEADFKQAGS